MTHPTAPWGSAGVAEAFQDERLPLDFAGASSGNDGGRCFLLAALSRFGA
ncbi:MAG: hypothetical protein QM784_07820 [Polyangiaceae bacterium]